MIATSDSPLTIPTPPWIPALGRESAFRIPVLRLPPEYAPPRRAPAITDPGGQQWLWCPICKRAGPPVAAEPARPPECCGRPLSSTDRPEVLAGEIPWADRRIADRRPVHPGARADVIRWGVRAGPDLAEELVDVSDIGVGVRLRMAVRRGEKLDVTLWTPGRAWFFRGIGVVRWCAIGEHGSATAGVQLSRRVTARVFREVAW